MKKIFLALAFAALLPWSVAAQDVRQRTVDTIVADALDQLPAGKQKDYNHIMNELVSTGAAGITRLGDMLVPADKGKNASVEYALYGVVSYVMAPDKKQERAEVRKGLAQAIENCTDNPNRAFLMNMLQRCATVEDAPFFVKYLNDDYLSEWAINGLAHTPGAEGMLLECIQTGTGNREKLAYAVGVKRLKVAEPILLEWLKEADVPTQKAIYYALGTCGSSTSLPVLRNAAKAVKYTWVSETDVTASYLRLLTTMAANGEGKQAVAAAKALMKATDIAYVRGAALEVIVSVEGRQAVPYILSALKDNSRAYRVNALRLTESFDDDSLYETLSNILKAKGEKQVKADLLNWLGTRHATSQIDAVVRNMNAGDEEIALAAIAAAGKIGGDVALDALMIALNGHYADAAMKALLAFNGKINPGVMKALDGDKTMQLVALKLAATRRMNEVVDKVFDMLASPDSEISTAAYQALPGVVEPSDFTRLSQLIEKEKENHVPQIQQAMKNALLSLPNDKQYAAIVPCITASSRLPLYYPVLAQTGNSGAIAEILKGYKGNHQQEAFAALLQVDSPEMIEVLYDIAVNDKANAQLALSRYATLVAQSSNTTVRKYQLYRKALEMATEVKLQNRLIGLLGGTHTYQALLLVEKYMDNDATAEAAAEAVRTIVAKSPEKLGGAPVRKALEKAITCFQKAGNADAGYAIDDIKGILQRLPDEAYLPMFGNVEWMPVALNPAQKVGMSSGKIKKSEALAAATAANCWITTGNGMNYCGGDESILGTGNYENFELWLEWKGTGKAGLGVRSIRQIDLGGDKSGVLSGNVNVGGVSETVADNAPGEWNTVYVKVVNDRVTVSVNGVMTANNVILENSCDRRLPAYVKGQLLLVGEGAPVEFRDMYLRELPSTPKFELSSEEAKEGFEVLFDGTSMHKWTGNTTDYVPVDGTIYVTAQYGGSGNLYTVKEYSDFVFRFEFSFVREGVNNGVGIRTPMGVDAAYEGMEIQILDHDAPIYKGLQEYQQHGSVYGIIPAKRVKFPALGEWNTEEIRAVGDHITVTVNGEVILDGNIREACQGHNVSEDGSPKNPYTVDKKNHPGLFNKSGHIGFLGHGSGVKFRNVRIKDLSK